MPNRVFIILCILLLPVLSLAQISFATIPDKQSISTGDVLQVQFILENAGEMDDFKAPDFIGFQVMHGPVETTGMSLVNGQLSRYKAMTYILKPLKKGRNIIRGATAIINGKLTRSNDLTIEVQEGPPPKPNSYPMNPGIPDIMQQEVEDYILEAGENASEKIRGNLLVRLEVDKTTAYIGEPIVATYKLYTRLRSESRVSKRPSMNGFSVYDMVEPDGGGSSVEYFQGRNYQVHIIRKTQLFPLQEGMFVLEPVELQNTIRFLRRKTGESPRPQDRSPLERMFEDLLTDNMGEWEEHHITLSSQPQTITIKSLPDSAPPGFNGAVGKFTMKAVLQDSVVVAGDNGSLELTLEGNGNLPLVNEPAWNLPAGFLSFETGVRENLNKMISPMSGSKTFTYNFSAAVAGIHTLAPIQFTYFDPYLSTYHTLSSDSIRFRITPSIKRAVSGTPGANEKKVREPRKSKLLIALVLGGTGLVALLLLLAQKKRRKRQETITVEKTATLQPREPGPESTDPLQPARIARHEGNAREYFLAIEKALWEVITDKMKLQRSAQQKPLALELLSLRGLAKDDVAALDTIWQQCDWALYAPPSILQPDDSLLTRAEELILRIRVI